jgi:hypothetical protein
MNAPRFYHRAIAVNVLLQMFLGMIWYGIFGQVWMTYLERNEAMIQRNGPTPYLVAIVSAAAMGYALTWVLQMSQVKALSEALKVGLIVGVIFTALPMLLHHAFAGFSWQLAAIDCGNRVVGTLLATTLLFLWQPKVPAVIVKEASAAGPVRSRAA